MIEREVLDRNEILVGQKFELRSKSGCGVVIYKMNNTSLKIERIIKRLSNAIEKSLLPTGFSLAVHWRSTQYPSPNKS